MDSIQYQLDMLTALNHKLSTQEQMYRSICDTSNNAYFYCTLATGDIYSLGNQNKFFDFPIKYENDFLKIIASVEDKYQAALKDVLYIDKTKETEKSVDCKLRDRNKYLKIQGTLVYDENSFCIKIISIKDTTKTKLQSNELDYFTYFDQGTGLYNRNYFVRLLSEAMRKSEHNNSVVSVMFIDIDGFHKINDGLGLIIADELVQVFGQYLKDFQSDDIYVSHFSSDIFCIAIYEPCGNKSVENIVREIKDRTKTPFLLSSKHEITISVCIGIAEYPEAAASALELINCAEIVMLKAKTKGKDNVQYFDTPILEDFIKTVKIEHKLQEAIHGQHFTLSFQPQFESLTGRLRGVEALIRWIDLEGN